VEKYNIMKKNRYMNRTLLILVLLIGVAGLWYGTYLYCQPVDHEETGCESSALEEQIWIPTEDDIAYQDSMYTIIRNTQSDVDTIKVHIEYILERLDNADIIIYVDDKEEADWTGSTQGN